MHVGQLARPLGAVSSVVQILRVIVHRLSSVQQARVVCVLCEDHALRFILTAHGLLHLDEPVEPDDSNSKFLVAHRVVAVDRHRAELLQLVRTQLILALLALIDAALFLILAAACICSV